MVGQRILKYELNQHNTSIYCDVNNISNAAYRKSCMKFIYFDIYNINTLCYVIYSRHELI